MARNETTREFAEAWISHRASSAWLHEHILYPRILDLLRPASGGSILDAGCGDGRLTQVIANVIRPREIAAYDINAELVKRCKRRCSTFATILQRDLSTGIAAPCPPLDAVVACNLLMHFDHSDCLSFLGSVSASLQNDGMVIVVVTHPKWASDNYAPVSGIFPFSLQRRWDGADVIQHYRDDAGYSEIFASCGLHVEQREDVVVIPNSSLSSRYAHQIGKPVYRIYMLSRSLPGRRQFSAIQNAQPR